MLDGRKQLCGQRPTIIDNTLDDYGAAYPGFLIMNPKLVLADEPTGNLDTQTGTTMHELLFRLNEAHGTTFLVVTHSQDLADKMPRVVHMRDGRIDSDQRNGRGA
mgnify:CR=1 FL=1